MSPLEEAIRGTAQGHRLVDPDTGETPTPERMASAVDTAAESAKEALADTAKAALSFKVPTGVYVGLAVGAAAVIGAPLLALYMIGRGAAAAARGAVAAAPVVARAAYDVAPAVAAVGPAILPFAPEAAPVIAAANALAAHRARAQTQQQIDTEMGLRAPQPLPRLGPAHIAELDASVAARSAPSPVTASRSR
jgi:hypothetical protein